MEHLFFNCSGPLPVAAKLFFVSIGLPNCEEGDSANALGGVYYAVSFLGMLIKIEENTYDFEDEYQYLVSIRKDAQSALKVDESLLQGMAVIVARLLADNQHTFVARETCEGIVVTEPHE